MTFTFSSGIFIPDSSYQREISYTSRSVKPRWWGRERPCGRMCDVTSTATLTHIRTIVPALSPPPSIYDLWHVHHSATSGGGTKQNLSHFHSSCKYSEYFISYFCEVKCIHLKLKGKVKFVRLSVRMFHHPNQSNTHQCSTIFRGLHKRL
jgi:hypothetical protein